MLLGSSRQEYLASQPSGTMNRSGVENIWIENIYVSPLHAFYVEVDLVPNQPCVTLTICLMQGGTMFIPSSQWTIWYFPIDKSLVFGQVKRGLYCLKGPIWNISAAAHIMTGFFRQALAKPHLQLKKQELVLAFALYSSTPKRAYHFRITNWFK